MNKMPNQHKQGRPKKTAQLAADEAARVINIALLIKQNRIDQIVALGFTEASAQRYVMKRRRGLTGAYIGTTAIELLGSVENRTQAALRMVVEHGFPAAVAARVYQIDRRNLLKVLPEARKAAAVEAIRRCAFGQCTVTASDLSCPPAQDDPQTSFLPKNTTP